MAKDCKFKVGDIVCPLPNVKKSNDVWIGNFREGVVTRVSFTNYNSRWKVHINAKQGWFGGREYPYTQATLYSNGIQKVNTGGNYEIF